MTQSSKQNPGAFKDNREEAILKAARIVFEKEGYEKAKVADIAKQVGVVEGTIFHRFKSKQGLVIKVMEGFYNEITEDLKQGLFGIEGIRNRIYFIIWFHFNVLIKNPGLCSIIISESRRSSSLNLSSSFRQYNRAYTNILTDTIKKGIQLGVFREDISVPMLRRSIFGSIEQSMWAYLVDDYQINLEESAKELTDFIFLGATNKKQGIEQEEVALLVKKLNQLL